ncbi:MAG TPA: hypothetical protein DDX98_08030 [Bacteroidales bacterium]|jgi:LuxR family maltose regulon positive regulatory protein|nr:hypothetical protein [Bacteroidales bacterium]
MLPNQVLTTKLNPPSYFQEYFKRDRLEELLEKNSNRIATIICAGAGYGKSTLVSHWVENKKAIWISCDTEMNDLKVLISYITYGFIKNEINPFQLTSKLLASQSPIREELLFNTFLSEINLIKEKIYVVLDDFHVLKNQQTIKLFQIYFRFPPENIHLVILTRQNPTFNIEKYRINQLLNEVGVCDLSITTSELKIYAKSTFNLTLNAYQIDAINRSTEGWFLGVNQLLISYKDLKTPLAKKLQILNQQQFNTYFIEEVIGRQSKDNQKVLFVCSLFSRFCKNLISTVLDDLESGLSSTVISQTLKNKNNFIISLDTVNKWFRFHHQFQEALEVYFSNHLFEDLRSDCLISGGKWLIANKLYEEGTSKMIASGNKEMAIYHLQSFRYQLLNTDQHNRLAEIYNLFPVADRKSNIELLLINAHIRENQGKIKLLPEIKKQCDEAIKKEKLNNQQLGECKLWNAVILYHSGKYVESLGSVNQALALLSDNAKSVKTFSYAYKAFALNALNKKDEALNFLNSRLDFLHKSETHSIVRILFCKVAIYRLYSELKNCIPFVSQIIDISERYGHYETLGMGLYFQLEYNYRTANCLKCEEYFKKAHEYRYGMRPYWYANILGIKIYCSLHQNYKGLKESIQQLDEFSKDLNADNISQFRNVMLTEVALREGNYEQALQLYKKSSFHLYAPFLYYNLTQITELKVLLYTNKTNDLETFYKASKSLWKFGRAQQHSNLLLQLNILNAIASHMQGKTNDATNYMSEALSISEATGDLLVYKEFSYHVLEVLVNMAQKAVSSSYLRRVLSLFEISEQNKTASKDSSVYPQNFHSTESTQDIIVESIVHKIEILISKRELQILELVAKGFKNNDIANTLFISVETVKKHLSSVYKKLKVKNRIGAVIKAKKFNLLKSQAPSPES